MRRVSLARQLLLLQLVVVLVTVGLVAWLAVEATDDATRDGERDRAVSVARALAASGEVRAALRRDDPAAALQPLAEEVRRRADLGFVVFLSPSGIRYSHPDPARIGGRFVGTIAPAVRGGEVVEETTGTLGPSVRAVVSIRDGGRVAGLVAVGVLQAAISDQVRDHLPALLASAVAALLVGAGLSMLLARRVRRHTRGMDPEQLGALYAHHDAVLHAIGEGVVVTAHDGRLALVNGEARRLLGFDGDVTGRRVDEVVRGAALVQALTSGVGSGVHVVGGRVLLSVSRPARVDGRHVGTVTTLRDRTELEGLVRELGTVRGLADALRAQAHESANELHTVVGLVELGRYDDAVAFATRRIGVTQDEADQVQERIGDPALAALLLAKAAACRERGVQLVLAGDSDLPAGLVPEDDLVTVVGNLIDNALDALAGRTGGRIEVRAHVADGSVELTVRDDGPGFADGALERAFEAGWSTKAGANEGRRGIGLALVAAATARLGGSAAASNDGGAVVTVRVPAHRGAGLTA
ncbi:MAG: sensor histidine kinase [Solirubrobacterales bacterium]|nr:sensor histidine kinase [Solirubrobacterales bacterium]